MLKPLHTKRRWVNFRTYDLEWDPYTMKTRCGVVYDGIRFYWYHTAEELLEYQLTAKNSGLTFYAHNGGRADFAYLLKFLKQRYYQVDACFSNSSANIVIVRRGKHHWCFVDSLWLFASPLAKIGQALGYEKGGPPIENFTGPDADQLVKDWYANAPLAELVDYCKRDCEILWRAIQAFQVELWSMGGELKKTIASSTMTLFRREYLMNAIKTNPRINLESRESYSASRVEVFRKTIDRGRYYDINSSFPYSMTKPQPGNLKKRWPRLPDLLHDEVPLVLAQCTVDVPEMDMPPLALRHNHKVYYPVGRWKSWFTGVDLRALVERGGKILDCKLAYEFHPFMEMQEYVTHIYSLRVAAQNAGNGFKSMVYKILLNSLYGKYAEGRMKTGLLINPTGEQTRKYGLYPDARVVDDNRPPGYGGEVDAQASNPSEIYPGIWTLPKEVDVPHEHVPVAASVTAYSRLLLLQHMEESARRGGTACYCDTDGFATDAVHETSKDLGGLKVEMEFSRGDFHAPKVYNLDGEKRRVKAKGFSLSKFESIREAQYDSLVYQSSLEDDNLGILVERMMRPQEMLKRSKTLTPRMVSGLKRLLLQHPKRYEYASGVTRPWHVKEIAEDIAR